MTTVLATFCISVMLSLFFTPLVRALGLFLGAMDEPDDDRKLHGKTTPRIGGAAVFSAFLLSVVVTRYLDTEVSRLLVFEKNILFLAFGGILCFGIGLLDDFRRLDPKIKFFFQILAASLAYSGGIRIGGFEMFGFYLKTGYFSYPLTVFWFLLFINAVNLIDGLDGLAGGIIVFASTVMVILAVLRQEYLTAILFTALGGSVLGFLRYNFNPATIFLGDGGSYFLGFAVAGLSILGSVKSQIGAVILIPLIALGVPLFDTIISPIRRFVRGRGLFQPDRGHVHHRLLAMGLSARKTVWVIYFISMCLCVAAVVLVNIRDEQAGLFLIVLGAGVVIFIQKLGYFEYLASDKLYGWFMDLSDTMGLTRQRRTFLSLQMDAGASETLEELWRHITSAMEILEFDTAALDVTIGPKTGNQAPAIPKGVRSSGMANRNRLSGNFVWRRAAVDEQKFLSGENLLKLEMPLLGQSFQSFGKFRLVKDVGRNPISHHTLRRVEYLRRTITGVLEKLAAGQD